MMPINSPRFGHRHIYIFMFYGKKQIPEMSNMANQMNEMDTYSTSSWSTSTNIYLAFSAKSVLV